MQVNLLSASGRFVEAVHVDAETTVEQLKTVVLGSKFKLLPIRQRLVLTSGRGKQTLVVLSEKGTLKSHGVKDGDSIIVKDLGPQISWRAVFVIEYLGPLLIHQLFFALRDSSVHPLNLTQLLAYACITFHFLKREYETLFIHRFSHTTMPLRNLFKNSAHYWLISGLLISYFLYSPSFASPSLPTVIISTILFLLFEVGNFYTHVVLSRLRPAGSTARGIPFGFGFNIVSCPNYTFEILAWIAFSTMTGLWASWFFTILASFQMYLWAVKKHKRYLKEFPNYPKNRKVLIPFFL